VPSTSVPLRTTRLYTRIRVYRIDDGVILAAGASDGAAELRAALGPDGPRWLDVGADGLPATLAGQYDHRPVALVAFGAVGDDAVVAAAAQGPITALVLVGVPLSANAIELVHEWPELPILAVADPADRAGLRGAVDAYLASDHAASEIIVGPLAKAWAPAAAWLRARLIAVLQSYEVMLMSEDGWELHATRWLPTLPVSAADSVAIATESAARTGGGAPGVVLLHTGRSDRAVFARLERLLAERGFAVLNVDWRGRGQSTNRGTYQSLSGDERAAGWRDAAAAFEHLAQCPEVDANRLAAVGAIHGAEHAVRAAQHDPRVRALVLLTGYRPASEPEGEYLAHGDVDVMYVTSTDHTITTAAMRQLYEASTRRRARYVEYPGGAIAYQLFDVDHRLEPAIVTWLVEVLEP
jgi:dienelactone hydrolase